MVSARLTRPGHLASRRHSGNQSGALVLPHGSSDDLSRAFEGAVGRELLSNGTGE